MAEWTGELSSSLYTKHTISSPAFLSIMVCLPSGEDLDFYARGHLATNIEKMKLEIGTKVTVTADDHRITNIYRA